MSVTTDPVHVIEAQLRRAEAIRQTAQKLYDHIKTGLHSDWDACVRQLGEALDDVPMPRYFVMDREGLGMVLADAMHGLGIGCDAGEHSWEAHMDDASDIVKALR